MEQRGTLGSFRYKNYEFLYHPVSFQISQRRNLKEFVMPQGNSVIQELGKEAMVVSGEGVLLGEDLMEQYGRLNDLFLDTGSGSLFLPGMSPIFCFWKELSVSGRPGPKMLTYRFSFLEDTERNSGRIYQRNPYYTVVSGDTLTLIAAKCNLTVEELLEKNPGLNGAGGLKEGTLVWL